LHALFPGRRLRQRAIARNRGNMGLGTEGGKQGGLPGTQVAAGGARRQREVAGGVWGRGWGGVASERGRCPWRFQAGAFGAGVQGSSVLRVFTYAPGLPVPARSAALVSGASYAWPALSVWYSDFS